MKKKEINKIMIDCMLITIILSSGTVIGYRNLSLIWIVQAITSMLLIVVNWRKIKILRGKAIKSTAILGAFFINLILVARSDIGMLGSMSISLISCFVLSCVCTKEELSKKYIYILSAIATLSLVQYVLSQFGVFIGGKIVRASGSTYFISMFYHVYRSWSTNMTVAAARNSGVFWEPGAYQVFLNLALLFLFKSDIKFKKQIESILIVSIITTRSTTGYIVLALWGILLLVQENKIKAKHILFLIAGIVVIAEIMTSPIVIEKLSISNDSTSVRLNDVIGSIQLCLQKPFIGFGYNNPEITQRLSALGIKYNSAGLLLFAIMFGIPFTGIVFYIMWYNISGIAHRRNPQEKIIILIVLIIIHMTEHFMVKEIFLMFLFEFQKEKIE